MTINQTRIDEVAEPTLDLDPIQLQVRERYAGAAIAAGTSARTDLALTTHVAGCCGDDAGCGCGDGCCGGTAASIGIQLYDAAERAGLPDAAVLASLGCGNPLAVAELREGETVLDLGSGGGIDVLLSARRVGPTGHAIGVDMTDEMLALAQRNALEAGIANAHFLRGEIENVPLPAESVDVVISNCVINLSTDKPAVLTEMARVLRPGGRLGISDIVAEDHLTPHERAERGSWCGCVAGALSRAEYVAGLEAAGFEDVSVHFTHEVAEGMHGAIVKGVKSA
jgi:arsenite methyltransferase